MQASRASASIAKQQKLQNNKCVNTFNEIQSETVIFILTSDGGHGQILPDKSPSIQRSSNSNKVRDVLRQTVFLCQLSL